MFNIFPTFSDYISDVGKVEKSGRRMLLECDCYSAASIAILLFQVRILIEGDIQQRVILLEELRYSEWDKNCVSTKNTPYLNELNRK